MIRSRDFEPVGQIALFEFCFAVPKDSPHKTMKDVAAWVKANPDKATYALPGAGTIPHFIGVSWPRRSGADAPSRLSRRRAGDSGSRRQPDPAVGRHAGGRAGAASGREHPHSGDKRARRGRSSRPTCRRIIESGFDVSGDAWYGMWAPKGTPKPEIDAMAAALKKVLDRADLKERLMKSGLVATGTDGTALVNMMRENVALWKPVIDAGGEAMRQ